MYEISDLYAQTYNRMRGLLCVIKCVYPRYEVSKLFLDVYLRVEVSDLFAGMCPRI